MAAGYAGVYLLGFTPLALYAFMAVMGVGWAAIVSLPFAIMSQHVDQARIGLYMGVFNLSLVLPQLVVSLGVGTLVARLADKGSIFVVGAISVGLSALAWLMVRRTGQPATQAAVASH
jgi:Na+/melibiose symporter-like transporter